jgi:hypothetical protein
MKKFVAILGLGLLAYPLWRHLSFERRLEGVDSVIEAVSTMHGVTGGLMIGCAGLMILGFLVDGGSGYRKPALLISMAVAGGLWIALYPSGWMLGIALVLYPLFRRFGFGPRSSNKNEKA